MEDEVDAPEGMNLDDNVDLVKPSDDKEEEDEEVEDEEVDDEKEEDEGEEEDKEEDHGKEPRKIGQEEMVNTSADDVNAMVNTQPIVLPEQGHEMSEHTPRPQPPAPTPRPQTLNPHAQSQTLHTHSFTGLEQLGLMTPQIPHPAVDTL
jgi:hypothetical protein